MEGLRFNVFRLDRRLGGGGMGEVWKALHEPTNQLVALKLLVGKDKTERERMRRSVSLEAEALARLSHPGVVAVLDRGVVPPDAPESLSPGAPWLAMEYCSDGHLKPERITEWRQFRLLIEDLLRVLAHIHARGMLHGDLKPGNILFDQMDESGRQRPKLADFGLARLLAASGADFTSIAGTPLYMAPEQIRNDWRSMGPATDLYSLACVVWRVLTGEGPYGVADKDIHSLLYGHLHWEPACLTPRFDVPPELDAWLGRALQKNPAERFACAADALAQLPGVQVTKREGASQAPTDPDDFQATTPIAWRPGVPGSALSGLIDSAWPGLVLDDHGELPKRLRPASGIQPIGQRICSMAEGWRMAWSLSTRPLLGPGLGLLALRSLPPLGRSELKDEIWQLLRRVAGDRQPRWIRLEGKGGVGTSHMVRWLTERAAELGAAQVWRIRPRRGSSGLLESLIELLRAQELEGLELADYLQRLLPGMKPRDRQALVRSISEGVGSERSFHALIWQVLRDMTRQRPMILAFDDIVHQAEALDLVDLIFDRATLRPLPVLVMIASTEEDLQQAPVILRHMEVATSMAEGITRTIAPLSPFAMRGVLDQLIHLDSDLADQVVASSGGRPLFGIHLVSDWLERGLLEPSAGGLRLKPGVPVQVPANLEELFLARLQLLMGADSEEAIKALEVASCGGSSFDDGDWIYCCGRLGILAQFEWLDRLVGATLLKASEDGFRFAHRMLSDCLRRRAEREGRVRDIHDAWAYCHRLSIGEVSGDRAEAIGRHLMAAERYDQAVQWLQSAWESAQIREDHHRALELLELADRATAALGIPKSDPIRMKIGFDRVGHLDLWAGPEAMLAALDPLLQIEERTGPSKLRTALWNARGVVAERMARLDEADQWYAQAMGATEDRHWLGMIYNNRAWSAFFRAQMPQAMVLFNEAWERMAEAEDVPVLRVAILQGLTLATLLGGNQEEAEFLRQQFREHFASESSPDLILRSKSLEANFLRVDGHFQEATECLAEAIRNCRRKGITESRMRRTEIQLTWSQLAQGPDARAKQTLTIHVQRQDPLLQQGARTGLLLHALQLRDSEEARQHLQALTELLDNQEYREVEAAPVLDLARKLTRTEDIQRSLRALSLRLAPGGPTISGSHPKVEESRDESRV